MLLLLLGARRRQPPLPREREPGERGFPPPPHARDEPGRGGQGVVRGGGRETRAPPAPPPTPTIVRRAVGPGRDPEKGERMPRGLQGAFPAKRPWGGGGGAGGFRALGWGSVDLPVGARGERLLSPSPAPGVGLRRARSLALARPRAGSPFLPSFLPRARRAAKRPFLFLSPAAATARPRRGRGGR